MDNMKGMPQDSDDGMELDGGSKIEILSKIVGELCSLAGIDNAKVSIEEGAATPMSPDSDDSSAPTDDDSSSDMDNSGSPEDMFQALMKKKQQMGQ